MIASVVKEVQTKALEHIKQTGVQSQWKSCVACFQAYQVTDLMLLDYIGKKSAEEVTAEDIQKLAGVYNAIKEGTTTVEETFKKPKQQEAIAQQAQAAADDAKNKAQKAMNRSQGKTGTAAKSSLVYKVITFARTATAQPMGWAPIITYQGKPWQLLNIQ